MVSGGRNRARVVVAGVALPKTATKDLARAGIGLGTWEDLPARTPAGSLIGLPFTVVLYGLLGSVVGLTCNVLWDRSQGERKEIVVDRLYERVDELLVFPMLRDYRIEYHFVGEERRRWHLSTLEEMKILKQGPATAIIREGQQGWPWVERIVP